MSIFIWAVAFIDLIAVIFIIFGWNGLSPLARRFAVGITIIAFPILGSTPISLHTLDTMKDTSFCLKCHTMEEHGKSLNSDDDEILAAVHYANNYIPKKTACYSCHTDYDMFGGLKAKIAGLRHMYSYYLITPPKPDELKIHSPYNIQNCLSCHDGARNFMTKKNHTKEPGLLEKIQSGEKGCLESGCHNVAHGVKQAMQDALEAAEEKAASDEPTTKEGDEK